MVEQPALQQATVCLETPVKGHAGYVSVVVVKAEQDPRLFIWNDVLGQISQQ